MKKVIVTLLAAIIMIASVSFNIKLNADACELPDCQNLFVSTLNETLANSNISEAEVSFRSEKIYDMNLNELGCLYVFYVDDEEGFAISVYHNGGFVISEIFLDTDNPYDGCPGLKVYPSVSVYVYYYNGQFCDANSKLPFSEEAVDLLSEVTFRGGEEPVVSTSQTIYYSYRSESHYWLCAYPPDYIGIPGYTNICVAIAAGNIVGYWDRFNVNLMPNFDPGELWNGEYYYYSYDSAINSMIAQLALLMNGGNGTTVAQCQTGLSSYCTSAGYTASYTTVMSNGSFDYNAAKDQIDDGEPILIFSEGFTIYSIYSYPNNGLDSYMGITCTGNHAMAGFGYMDVTYTFSDNTSQTSHFIKVASGQSTLTTGYYNISTHNIDDAFSIYIS